MVLPENWYIRGMGLVGGIAIVIAIGLLSQILLFRKLIEFGEAILDRMPVVKSVYRATKDFVEYFSGDDEGKFNQVVLVRHPDLKISLLGFITREDFSTLPFGKEDEVAVYLPLSYQIAGYTIFVFRPGVVGTGADDAVVGTLLHDVGGPAGQARHHEDGREQLGRDAHEVVGRGVVEVGVGEQLLLPHMTWSTARRPGTAPLSPTSSASLRDHSLMTGVARVRLAVDGMAEAHDLFLALEHAACIALGFLDPRSDHCSSMAMAASLAPPCSGPRREPMAPVMQECMSDSVEAQTRAVKVEALNSCSA
jgi:hypothetical protein